MSSAEHNERRNRVWDQIRELAYSDPAFRAAVEPIGLFTFMRFVDALVDALFTDAPGEPNSASQ